MKVRYSYLKQQLSNCPELWVKLKKFVKTRDLTIGKDLGIFERNFAKLIGTKYAFGVNSRTGAIKIIL
jgi:dTDP-4-amino-4,6-dideoxygalactose transaminase